MTALSGAMQALPEAEMSLRRELAAAYRLIAHFGMDDLIYTHISARVPGPEHHFLINPYGLMFEEITASSLVLVDLDGKQVRDTDWPFNPAGFTIHSAIHMSRPDAMCVVHTHTQAGMAIASLECGLLPVNQMSLECYGNIATHRYEGIALNHDERPRIVEDLGNKSCLILINHGLLTVGSTIPEAFYNMYYLEQACRIQIAAMSTGAALALPSSEVCEWTAKQLNVAPDVKGQRAWTALRRKLDRDDPSYAS